MHCFKTHSKQLVNDICVCLEPAKSTCPLTIGKLHEASEPASVPQWQRPEQETGHLIRKQEPRHLLSVLALDVTDTAAVLCAHHHQGTARGKIPQD